jgi:hypothetical protein
LIETHSMGGLMSGFWKRGDDLERRLRHERPTPRADFMDSLTEKVESPRRRRSPLRLGFATGITVAMVVALGAFGGLSYAASSVNDAVHAALKIVVVNKNQDKPKKDEESSSHGQYGDTEQVCVVEPNGKQHTIRLPKREVAAYLAKHARSHSGACKEEKKK